jgi:hypothetical protein
LKQIDNIFSEELAKELYELGISVATNRYSGERLRIWTNFAWSRDIVKDSPLVLCMQMPNVLALKVQKELESIGEFDPKIHKQLIDTGGALIYLWGRDSYIPSHTDYIYSKAITVYLNRSWSYNDGGFFNWKNESDDKWNMVLPAFNRAIINTSGSEHGTTPVKSEQLRITAQIFLHSIN